MREKSNSIANEPISFANKEAFASARSSNRKQVKMPAEEGSDLEFVEDDKIINEDEDENENGNSG